jgi:hypothetical protein
VDRERVALPKALAVVRVLVALKEMNVVAGTWPIRLLGGHPVHFEGDRSDRGVAGIAGLALVAILADRRYRRRSRSRVRLGIGVRVRSKTFYGAFGFPRSLARRFLALRRGEKESHNRGRRERGEFPGTDRNASDDDGHGVR